MKSKWTRDDQETLRESLRSRELARPLVREIRELAESLDREMRIMEVCGTHTVALRRSGIHSFLPDNVRMISGPGCPVCVTPTGYIDNALALLEEKDCVIATFGDMLKVPGSEGRSLSRYMGTGRVRIVYSPAELIEMAREADGQSGGSIRLQPGGFIRLQSDGSPAKSVVFLGIGFETTIPAIASVFLNTGELGIENLYLYTAFKTVPLALRALLKAPDRHFDAFLLPGHVSVILGTEPYEFLKQPGGVPGVITGFEPIDLLSGILAVLRLLAAGENRVENAYPRAVRKEGNPRARAVMNRLLYPVDELWRGLGVIPLSGMQLKPEFAALDAAGRFDLPEIRDFDPPGCSCAQVIQGKLLPYQCPLFGRPCTPEKPIGPCMVSSEGSCAAHFRYGDHPL